jgi:hypothetical protein
LFGLFCCHFYLPHPPNVNHVSIVFKDKSVTVESDSLERLTDPETVPVPTTYNGVKVKLPLTIQTVNKIMSHYKSNKPLHAKYVLVILREAREKFKVLPNVHRATTSIAKQITICGKSVDID